MTPLPVRGRVFHLQLNPDTPRGVILGDSKSNQITEMEGGGCTKLSGSDCLKYTGPVFALLQKGEGHAGDTFLPPHTTHRSLYDTVVDQRKS